MGFRTIGLKALKGDIPPVSVINDLPSSVVGMNKHHLQTEEDVLKKTASRNSGNLETLTSPSPV